MHRLLRFLQSRWEEILWMGVWIPLALTAILTGSVLFIVFSLAGGLASLAALYSLIDKLRTLRRRQPTFGGEASGVPRKGLLFTVGLQSETIAYALQGQKPQYVGFLCTEQTLKVAEALVASQSLPQDRWRREIVDPRDIADVRAKTHLLLDWMVRLGLKPEEIVLDPTGGMTPMSLGAFSVTQERQIDAQYVRSRYDDRYLFSVSGCAMYSS